MNETLLLLFLLYDSNIFALLLLLSFMSIGDTNLLNSNRSQIDLISFVIASCLRGIHQHLSCVALRLIGTQTAICHTRSMAADRSISRVSVMRGKYFNW